MKRCWPLLLVLAAGCDLTSTYEDRVMNGGNAPAPIAPQQPAPAPAPADGGAAPAGNNPMQPAGNNPMPMPMQPAGS